MVVSVLPINETIGRSRTVKGWAVATIDYLWHSVLQRFKPAWMLLLLPLIPIRDTRPVVAAEMYDAVHRLFLQGDLIKTQKEAEHGYQRYLNSDPEEAARFQLLLARALISRGMNQKAVEVLAVRPSKIKNRQTTIESLTLEGVANTYLPQYETADRKLKEALKLCQPADYAACSNVRLARGVLALEEGKLTEARQVFMECLSLARTRQDRRSEIIALAESQRYGLSGRAL